MNATTTLHPGQFHARFLSRETSGPSHVETTDRDEYALMAAELDPKGQRGATPFKISKPSKPRTPKAPDGDVATYAPKDGAPGTTITYRNLDFDPVVTGTVWSRETEKSAWVMPQGYRHGDPLALVKYGKYSGWRQCWTSATERAARVARERLIIDAGGVTLAETQVTRETVTYDTGANRELTHESVTYVVTQTRAHLAGCPMIGTLVTTSADRPVGHVNAARFLGDQYGHGVYGERVAFDVVVAREIPYVEYCESCLPLHPADVTSAPQGAGDAAPVVESTPVVEDEPAPAERPRVAVPAERPADSIPDTSVIPDDGEIIIVDPMHSSTPWSSLDRDVDRAMIHAPYRIRHDHPAVRAYRGAIANLGMGMLRDALQWWTIADRAGELVAAVQAEAEEYRSGESLISALVAVAQYARTAAQDLKATARVTGFAELVRDYRPTAAALAAMPAPRAEDAVTDIPAPIDLSGRYWWHDSVAKELRRLATECGKRLIGAAVIADNIRMSRLDVEKYLGQMLAWGEVTLSGERWSLVESFNVSNPDGRTYEIREVPPARGSVVMGNAWAVVDVESGHVASTSLYRDKAEEHLARLMRGVAPTAVSAQDQPAERKPTRTVACAAPRVEVTVQVSADDVAEGDGPSAGRKAEITPTPEVIRVTAETIDFRQDRPQIYRHEWHGADRVVRFIGTCILCRTRCYSHDDGDNDPRGILGDHADSTMRADEYDMAGPDVVACFLCLNDDYRKYDRALAIARKSWRPAASTGDPVRDALAAATVTGVTVALTGQMNRATYAAVDEVLRRLGGKWNRKTRVHDFSRDPREGIRLFVADGTMPADLDRELSYWPTPDGVADRLVSMAGVAGLSAGAWVLEPSAGDGAIARAVTRANGSVTVQCVEVDETRAATLVREGFEVTHGRFQDFGDAHPFDAVVMNPPFTEPGDPMAWTAHVERAFDMLTPGGTLVAIVPRSVEYRDTARVTGVRALIDAHGTCERLPDGAFKDAGTGVQTNVITLVRPVAPRIPAQATRTAAQLSAQS